MRGPCPLRPFHLQERPLTAITTEQTTASSSKKNAIGNISLSMNQLYGKVRFPTVHLAEKCRKQQTRYRKSVVCSPPYYRKSVVFACLFYRKSVYFPQYKHKKSVFMLYRKIGEFISSHLQTPDGKILLIDGARQIGKSYIIRHIDQKKFKNYIELNMEEDKFAANKRYNVHQAFVLSNKQTVNTQDGITYMPVYYIMCFKNQ